MMKFLLNPYHRLFIVLFLLFIFRPMGAGHLYFTIWDLVLAVSLLFTIFAFNKNRVVRWVSLICVISSAIFNWLDIIYPSNFLFIGNAIGTTLYMSIGIFSIIQKATKSFRDPIESLKGVIGAFLLVAFLFAYIYYVDEFLQPGSYHFFAEDHISRFSYSTYLSQMLYLSFMTLLTIGFGDITPVREAAQSLVVIEGLIGQIYIAVLVGSVVSVYTMIRHKKHL